MTIAYHLSELSIIQDIGNPNRIVPGYPCDGWSILDIGCGIGQTLMARELVSAKELHGVDIDRSAIEYGMTLHPGLKLKVGSAERLPFPSDKFDLTFSRVAIPYMHIPSALREIHRVTRSGGHLWLTLHPWRMEAENLRSAIKSANPKRLADRIYIAINSAVFAITGRCFKRPWSGLTETVQTAGSMRRALERAGFVEISVSRGRHFLAKARKP